jgi:hypothetical protein
MESLGEKSKSSKGFFKYLFNFDDETKGRILNIAQYALLAFIPAVLLNKTIQKFVPEADDEKGSLEITAEIIIQLLVMFIGVFFINRLVTYLPTYSGLDYPEYEPIYSILAIIMLVVSLQTKIGEKTNILIERLTELWEGKMGTGNNNKNTNKSKNNNSNSTNNIKVSQPISQNQLHSQSSQGGYSDGTSIGQLPNYQTSTQSQSSPDFNSMHQKDPTPLVNAATPGEGFESGGIMAANEVLGGGGMFSSW